MRHYSNAAATLASESAVQPRASDWMLRPTNTQPNRRGPLPELMAYLQGAAAHGSPAGQYALACHYETGAGVALDRARARAFSWADNDATLSASKTVLPLAWHHGAVATIHVHCLVLCLKNKYVFCILIIVMKSYKGCRAGQSGPTVSSCFIHSPPLPCWRCIEKVGKRVKHGFSCRRRRYTRARRTSNARWRGGRWRRWTE